MKLVSTPYLSLLSAISFLEVRSFQPSVFRFIENPSTFTHPLKSNDVGVGVGPLFAGFGSSASGNKKKGGKAKGKKNTSVKKKIQLKQKLEKEYGGDIAKGTEQRVKATMDALPPEIQATAELYRKVARWDAYINSIPEEKVASLPPRDVDGANRAKIQLELMYKENGLDDVKMHNIFQKATWDASADAKAIRASMGKMPSHIEQRVDRACELVADAVKKSEGGRKNGRCLDVGCGHGAIVPNLTKAGLYTSQITGVDLSTEMIKNAEQTYRGVHFIATDFINEYQPSDYFDGIIFCSTLHDLPDMVGSLEKAASMLRPNGVLVLLHAQGAMHVAGQHKANPVMVKRGLPSAEELEDIANSLNLVLEIEPADAGSKEDESEGYLAVLRKAS